GVHAVLTRDELTDDIAPTYGYFIKDQPIVAMDKVRYEGDIVAAVAAEDEASANRALATIKVVYQDLPPVATMEDALSEGAAELFEEPPMGIVPGYGQGASGALRAMPNVCYTFSYETGSPDLFESCDHIFEDEFRFSRMHHLHLEPFVSVADWKDGGGIEIWGSCQNPFGVRKELGRMFKLPENKINIRVPYIGGGYGAKNNCKTEPIAVLLSKLSGRPVRFCLTAEEGFLTNTQHAAILKLKTGVMKDGTLVARESVIYLDSGAYSDASPLVAEKAGYRIPGPYRFQHIKTDCHCVMTNTAPAGPFRGFGGTQATWAGESQLDMIAHRLGIDPYDMRLKNFVDLGEPFVPGESGMDSDLREGMELVAREVGYFSDPPAPTIPGGRRAFGLAMGFKDGGGVNKPAQARVKVSTFGDIFLHCGTIEMGQGAHTALSNVVAEIMGVAAERVSYVPFDSSHTPFDQGTNASSAVAVMGQAVEKAARALHNQVLIFAAERMDCDKADLKLEDWTILKGNEAHPLGPMMMGYYGGAGFEFTADGFHKAPTDHDAPLEAQCVFWELGWGAVDVEVDPATGRVILHKLIVSGDAGQAINPLVCRGQDEGSAVMGIGQALFEEMVYDGTRLVNGETLAYRVPMAQDLPATFTSITQEQGHGPGPFGSKGMGEGGLLPVAPAIANAIFNATGARITSLPLTPQRVKAALESLDAAPK
ncbi:MAG: molybdopterin-dependent oxidoreductase, partial [Proteobacteria bacterium]|nr:molybdopterin-dependent oxidoreductase [Pseudomonadota bacterium]